MLAKTDIVLNSGMEPHPEDVVLSREDDSHARMDINITVPEGQQSPGVLSVLTNYRFADIVLKLSLLDNNRKLHKVVEIEKIYMQDPSYMIDDEKKGLSSPFFAT